MLEVLDVVRLRAEICCCASPFVVGMGTVTCSASFSMNSYPAVRRTGTLACNVPECIRANTALDIHACALHQHIAGLHQSIDG